MSVTPTDSLAGVLPVVISGRRPLLSHRTTRRLLPFLLGKTADPVWLVRDDEAPTYERDQYEIVTFPREAAEEFAKDHWLGPDRYEYGTFLGCFTQREWACRVAAERGYWAVLELDDNIQRLSAFAAREGSNRVVRQAGGLGMFADILAAVTLSTNSRMTGAMLMSINPASEPRRFARAGFPYSLYLERVDKPDRDPYYGPIEEDILHAYHYMSAPNDATAALVRPLLYSKEHQRSKESGMRQAYKNQRRSAGLQLVNPELCKVGVHKGHSNGLGSARIFHKMTSSAIRTPLVVKDQSLFDAAAAYVTELRDKEIAPALQQSSAKMLHKRAASADRKAALRAHLARPAGE